MLVQGFGPAVVILPSCGRDGRDDYNRFSSALVDAGYLVLRPQPRGILDSVAPMQNVTMNDSASDIIRVIDALGGGQAIVMVMHLVRLLRRLQRSTILKWYLQLFLLLLEFSNSRLIFPECHLLLDIPWCLYQSSLLLWV